MDPNVEGIRHILNDHGSNLSISIPSQSGDGLSRLGSTGRVSEHQPPPFNLTHHLAIGRFEAEGAALPTNPPAVKRASQVTERRSVILIPVQFALTCGPEMEVDQTFGGVAGVLAYRGHWKNRAPTHEERKTR